MNRLTRLVEDHALLSLEKQDKLARLVGEHFPDLDLDRGVLNIGAHQFPFQVIGTTSDNTLSWLWAWSEAQSDIPGQFLQSAHALRAWGANEGIAEFTDPDIDLNRATGQVLSFIACGICRASAHYQDRYEGGSLYLLIQGNDIDSQPSLDRERVLHHLSELPDLHDINQQRTLLAYLRAKNRAPVVQGTMITCGLENGETLNLEFDELGSIRGR